MPELTQKGTRKRARTVQLLPATYARLGALQDTSGVNFNRLIDLAVLGYVELLNNEERTEAMRRTMEENKAWRRGEETEPLSQ